MFQCASHHLPAAPPPWIPLARRSPSQLLLLLLLPPQPPLPSVTHQSSPLPPQVIMLHPRGQSWRHQLPPHPLPLPLPPLQQHSLAVSRYPYHTSMAPCLPHSPVLRLRQAERARRLAVREARERKWALSGHQPPPRPEPHATGHRWKAARAAITAASAFGDAAARLQQRRKHEHAPGPSSFHGVVVMHTKIKALHRAAQDSLAQRLAKTHRSVALAKPTPKADASQSTAATTADSPPVDEEQMYVRGEHTRMVCASQLAHVVR